MKGYALSLTLLVAASSIAAPTPLKAGEPAPGEGVFLPTSEAIALYQACASDKELSARLAAQLEEKPSPPPQAGVVLVAGVLGVLAGGAAALLFVHK